MFVTVYRIIINLQYTYMENKNTEYCIDIIKYAIKNKRHNVHDYKLFKGITNIPYDTITNQTNNHGKQMV